jgi:fused signal recognition particle receptor
MSLEILSLVTAGGVCALAALFLLRRRRRIPERHTAAPAPATVLRNTFAPTRQGFLTRLQGAWGANTDVDARLAGLEEILLTADVGPTATRGLLSKLRPRVAELRDVEAVRAALRDEMCAVLLNGGGAEPATTPHVILVAGVNGVGKTTTIGKLAHRHRQAGKKVLLVAADTYRAAASEQLERWAQRVGAACVRHQSGADPSAVVFDGLTAAVARGVDVVIVDTAGRLHVKTHLIEELKKIARTITRQVAGAPHEVLLVIDATTGQNAINQARVFCEALPLTGIVLTKLDGTAKGGAVFAVRAELGVPIRYVGLGEGPEALVPFDADVFVDALLTPGADAPPQA